MLQFLARRAKPMRVRVVPTLLALAILACASPHMVAGTLLFSGNLRTDATVTDCGTGCTLNGSNTDYDYAQFAAVVNSFTVSSSSTMNAISFSYGGGTSATGPSVAAGGLEPLLSLFDSGGNFLESTYLGTTCPTGAGTYDGNCYDVLLDGGTLAAGTYYIALTAYANMSIAENYGYGNLSDGFTGLGSLALDEDLHYAYDVNLTPLTSSSATPEPNFGFLVGIAVLASLTLRKLRLRADAGV